MNTRRKSGLIAVAVLGLLVTVASEVFAVIGRPLTPVSVAGVARRSVRRNVYY
jgi:hypothetical protein